MNPQVLVTRKPAEESLRSTASRDGLFETAASDCLLVSNRPLSDWYADASRTEVTFIVLSYNNAGYLPQTLESVERQTVADMEIVISDDGSSDASVQVIRDWLHKSQRPALAVLWQRNGGIARNYNSALQWARGRHIAHIGSDDVNIPHRVEAQLQALKSSNASMCISGMEVIDDKGRHLRSVAPKVELQERSVVLASGSVAVTSPTMMYDRQLIDAFGPLPSELANEDEALAMRAAFSRGITILDQALVRYRIHGSSVTARNRQLTLTGYLSWMRTNLPMQMANKRHWLQVLQATKADSTDVEVIQGHLETLARQHRFVDEILRLSVLGQIGELLSKQAGRVIVRAYLLQLARALRVMTLISLAAWRERLPASR
ncbi:MAG: glycosyltransferase [Nitrospiraceae bacterium]|nr:glycosyltransferase [Nitrospiraceae bacterium]